jgi:hypothetical protein
MTRPSFDVHIDALVLYGFERRECDRIGEAVERELARLVAADPPRPLRTKELEAVDAGMFDRQSTDRASATGAQVAGAVYRSLTTLASE